MDPTLLQQQLKDGIQAVRQGDRARGEALLLQVVAADERNEPAWLWLSQALTAPADQLVALENVLTLNPDNTAARAQAQALRQQLGLAPPPAPLEPPPPHAEAESAAPPAASDDAFDNDPDQCLYCGQLTEPEAATCPYCHHSLLQAGRTEEAGSYRWLILLSVAILQFSILQPGVALAKVVVQAGNVSGFVYSAAAWAMVARIFLWLVGFLVILTSQNAAATAAVAVGLVDIGFIGLGWALGWTPPQPAAIWVGLDLPLLGLGAATLLNRGQARVRQYTVLDRNAYGHAELYRRGRRYARQGKWALAALHWQRAMVLRPTLAEYYIDLSVAQAQLGRYPQALRTLHAGADRLPDNPEFPARIAALEKSLG
jgi:tetratricopeptide (TPR) repeat protein